MTESDLKDLADRPSETIAILFNETRGRYTLTNIATKLGVTVQAVHKMTKRLSYSKYVEIMQLLHKPYPSLFEAYNLAPITPINTDTHGDRFCVKVPGHATHYYCQLSDTILARVTAQGLVMQTYRRIGE